MENIFSKYRIILLDSSFFVSEFSEKFKEGLRRKPVYVADTLNAEIEQFKTVLSSRRRHIYEANVNFLNTEVRVTSPDFSTFGAYAKNLNGDIWGLIQLITNFSKEIVVATANYLLIQKIISHNLEIDVYDLHADTLLRYNAATSRSINHGISDLEEQIEIPDTPFKSGNTVYLGSGAKLTLGKEIRSGREGTLFKISDRPELIAKIFHKDSLPAEKYRTFKKLAGINQAIDVDWVEFPLEPIFSDAAGRHPIGFIENFVSAGKNLDENALFSGDPLFSTTDQDLETRQSEVVRLCTRIVCQICYLNTYGFFLSDFNMGNFAENPRNDQTVQMWDTDSFGYDTYFSGLFDSEFTESRNHPAYDASTKAGTIDICNEALYQFVFKLFSLGDPPISSYTGKFKYDNQNYPGLLYRKALFPKSLWKHMESVFRGERAPSAEELLRQLLLAKEEVFYTDKTYSELLRSLIPDFADVRREAKNFKLDLSGGTSSGGTSSGGTSTGNTSTGKTSTGKTSIGKTSIGKTSISGTSTGNTSTGKTSTSGTSTGKTSIGGTSTGKTSTSGTSTGKTSTSSSSSGDSSTWKKILIVLLILAGMALLYYYVNDYLPQKMEDEANAQIEIERVNELTLADYAGWTIESATVSVQGQNADVETRYEYSATTKKDYVIYNYYSEYNNTVTLVASSGLEPDSSFEAQAYLDVSPSEVTLTRDGTAEMTVSASGNLPDRYHFSFVTYTNVQSDWGDWLTNNSAAITISGAEGSSGYARFYIEAAETDQRVGYADVYIQINE